MKYLISGLASLILALVLIMGNIHPVLAQLSGTYVFANDGNYFSYGGTSAYWHIASGQGYCGQYATWCSPYNMRWTYTNGSSQDNWGQWNLFGSSSQTGTAYNFIPRVNTTTRSALYELFYGIGATALGCTTNQNNYYDQWVYCGSTDSILYMYLSDATGESAGSTRVGFDEVKVVY